MDVSVRASSDPILNFASERAEAQQIKFQNCVKSDDTKKEVAGPPTVHSTMTASSPSYRAFRTPLILLAILSACSESFATHAVKVSSRAHAYEYDQGPRGILGGTSGPTSTSRSNGPTMILRSIKPGKSFAGLFNIGRGGGGNGPPAPNTSKSILLAQANDIEAPPPSNNNDVSTSNSKLGPNAPPPGIIRRLFPWFPWHQLPDLLTYIRCLAIPLLVVLYYLPNNRTIVNSVLFAGASITDWLDGYLARRWDITSAFGAFLDPVADKLMVSTALILLSGTWGAIVAIPSAIILAREIAVSALREWMAQRGLRDSVKVGFQGKMKTAATMVALTILLLVPEGTDSIFDVCFEPAMAMLYLSAVVTVTSGSVYFRAAAPVLMGKE